MRLRHDWPGDMEHVLEARLKTKKHKVLDKGIAKRSMIKPTDLCTAYK